MSDKVSDENCRDCKYFYGNTDFDVCCNYIFVTGKRRPCHPVTAAPSRSSGSADWYRTGNANKRKRRMLNFRQENKRFGWNGEGVEYPEWVEECDFL